MKEVVVAEEEGVEAEEGEEGEEAEEAEKVGEVAEEETPIDSVMAVGARDNDCCFRKSSYCWI